MIILKVLLAPFLFVLAYMTYVCIIGIIPAFLLWDITVITHTVFPWQKHEDFNTLLGSVSAVIALIPTAIIFSEDF